jgi:DNA-binding PadR family transcriptional regulator
MRTIMIRAMTKSATTTLGYALLGLLHQQSRSGYDLRKIFETTPMAHFSGSPGAIYPALRKLEKQSLIKGKVDRGKPLRPRQVFQPTTAGTDVFRTWLASGIQREDVIWRAEALMLRFAFQSFLEDELATREFLDDFLREVKGYLVELRMQLKMMPADTPIHARLALESGVESYLAHRRWAIRALEHFEEKKA